MNDKPINPVVALNQPKPIPVAAPNILLMGMPGTGKTHALRTLIDAGKEVFIIFTEPGMEVLADTDPDQVHWMYVPPGTGTVSDMIKSFKTANKLSWDALVKTNDPNKKAYDSAVKLVETFENFTCDRTGAEFGSVFGWGTDRAFALDSLSGVNKMAMQLIIGATWSPSQPQWGAAMKAELNLVDLLCLETKCTFILNAHLERLVDEVFGGMVVQVNALGRKNAPELPKNFSDVILTKYEQGTFRWSTEDAKADLKTRNLKRSASLPPDFKPLLAEWQKRVDAAENLAK